MCTEGLTTATEIVTSDGDAGEALRLEEKICLKA